MTTGTPRTPSGLKTTGRRLWQSITAEYELEDHEASLLLSACRIADNLGALQRTVEREGVTIDSPQGVKAHPALVEHRQQSIAYARLVSALRLPAGDEAEGQDRRPQRRTGMRGTYQLGVAR